MIPWILVTELLCTSHKPASCLVKERIAAFPSSGEINSTLADPDASIQKILDRYKAQATEVDYTDGIGLEFDNWRFNLRKSNTEPVVRLNVESKGDILLMEQKTKELLDLLK